MALTFNSKNLLIIGHKVEDTVIVDFGPPKQKLGGIYNISNAFRSLDNKNNTTVIPSSEGKAVIVIDKKTSSKWVKAEINQKNLGFPKNINSLAKKYDWTHIAYANMLKEVNYPKDGIVSVDWCAGPFFYLQKGRQPNYIFIAEDEFSEIHLSIYYRNSIIISHNQFRSSIIKDGQKLFTENVDVISNVNPLGAGDFFAASFIHAKLNKKSDKQALKFANNKTREWLPTNQ